MANVCCTCASIVPAEPLYDAESEKHIPNKRLDCCGRLVCGECTRRNPRFGTYCTFCQTPTPLTPGTSQAAAAAAAAAPPPAYSDTPVPHTPPGAPHPAHASLADLPDSSSPPPYSATDDGSGAGASAAASDEKHPDVMHYLSPEDSMTSLSLAYGVPLNALRQLNNLWSDHLLSARKIVLVPGRYYQGPSLAPDPVEDEVETERKARIRRLMTRCKIYEYDVAVLYLEQQNWDYEAALQRFLDDERWEREHPLKGKQRALETRSIGRRLASRS